jgi:amino acid permease
MSFSIKDFSREMSKGVITGCAVGAITYGLNYLGLSVTVIHPLAAGVGLGLNNAVTNAFSKELKAKDRVNSHKELKIREIFCRVIALSAGIGAYTLVTSLDYQASLITGGLLAALSLSYIFGSKEKGPKDFK